MLAPISDDDKKQIRVFGRKLVARLLLSAAGAIGTKVGELVVESLFGGSGGGDEDEDDSEEKRS